MEWALKFHVTVNAITKKKNKRRQDRLEARVLTPVIYHITVWGVMMTTNSNYSYYTDKRSVNVDYKTPTNLTSSYVTNCQVCGWNGYPYEKVIIEFEGIRSEEEEGFIDKFTEYDYDCYAIEKRTKHTHKYNAKLIQAYVDIALQIRNCGSNDCRN
jgi:hypothetical protein